MKPSKPSNGSNGKASPSAELDTNRARQLLQDEAQQNHEACLAKIQAALDEHGYTLAADTEAMVDQAGFIRCASTVILVAAPRQPDPRED